MSGTIAKTRFSALNRLFLPGLAFKAVVIGGGYATGRELVEFFLGQGPIGGVLGLVFAGLCWSVLCAMTFLFARRAAAYDYKSFFVALLGPLWPLFELSYLALLLLLLSVFSAAAGAIAARVFGAPEILGVLALSAGIIAATALGNASVERVFRYVSLLLYVTYGIFLLLSLIDFGPQIAGAFRTASAPRPAGWLWAGLSYASYNVVGAVLILPVLRHATRDRDVVVAGVLAGPLAILPASIFFISISAFGSTLARQALPSDFLLSRMNAPWFRLLFEAMIFAALLESATGAVHAVNERFAMAWCQGRRAAFPVWLRATSTIGLLVIANTAAVSIGLTALIAHGYRALAYVFLLVFILPLLLHGLIRLFRRSDGSAPLSVQDFTP